MLKAIGHRPLLIQVATGDHGCSALQGACRGMCSHAGVLIWCYGTTVGARATYSGTKHEISGARDCLHVHILF